MRKPKHGGGQPKLINPERAMKRAGNASNAEGGMRNAECGIGQDKASASDPAQMCGVLGFGATEEKARTGPTDGSYGRSQFGGARAPRHCH